MTRSAGNPFRSWWLSDLRARRLVWLPIVMVVGLVSLAIIQTSREPAYQGKRLTLWLRTYSSSAGRTSPEWQAADDAVRHMGTNCLPVLFRMIRAGDSRLKLRLVVLAQKQTFIKIHFIPAANRNVAASRAFIVLGDTARSAVPALARMLGEDITLDSRRAIEDSLGWIGPAAEPALPLLLLATTNSDRATRANALWALGGIHAAPERCVPELTRALGDSDEWIRLSAAHALGMFGTNARSAVPRLMELANFKPGNGSLFSGMQPRLEARNAIQKIEPGLLSPPAGTIPDSGAATLNWPISEW